MDINQLINQHYENFSETDHHIWQYIYKHMKECPQYSLSELAERCSVSNNSILSFCKKLGMDGYGELRVILKWQEQTNDVLAVNLLNRTYQDYYLTLDYLKNLDLTKTFELFDCPGRIFIFGTGEVQRHAAKELKRLFFILQKRAFVIESKTELETMTELLKKEDTLIVFSLSGDNRPVNNLVRGIKNKGTSILSITSYEDNELEKLSH